MRVETPASAETSSTAHCGPRYPSVVSLMVVRAFVRLRELVAGNKELAQKLLQLERKVGAHDKSIAEIINAIRELMSPSEPKKKRPIGFAPWKEK